MSGIILVLVVMALVALAFNTPGAKRRQRQHAMRQTVKNNRATRLVCPHCRLGGEVVPAGTKSSAGNAGKLLAFGPLGLLAFKSFHCNNCDYTW